MKQFYLVICILFIAINLEAQIYPGTTYSGTTTGTSNSGTVSITKGSNTVTTNYSVVQNSTAGYATPTSVAYNVNNTQLIEVQNSGNSSNNNDEFSYTISTSATSPCYNTQIVLYQRKITGGNNEASTYTVSWVGGTGNAVLSDPTTPSASGNFQYGVPSGFDLNNGQVEGLSSTVNLTSPSSFTVYNIKNEFATWSVTFPPGATSVTVKKVTLKGATATYTAGASHPNQDLTVSTDPASGKDANYPWYGRFSNIATGESFNEWITFGINFNYIGGAGCTDVLPIQLKEFSAVSKNCGTDLQWKSGTESNFSHFELQRSTNGVEYYPVATIAAKGSESHYVFNDDKAAIGINYYRLKMIDYNNTFAYSNVASTNNICSNIKLTPTYSTNGIFTLRGLPNNNIVMVYDAQGKKLLQLKNYNATQYINLSKQPAGVYFIKVFEGGKLVFETKAIK